MIVTLGKGQMVILEANAFASGGEGEVYRISGDNKRCVKIFHPDKCTPEKLAKLKYMIQNKPQQTQSSTFLLCWPEDLAFVNGQMVGFVMPLAFPDSELVYSICSNKITQKLQNKLSKYDFSSAESDINRLKLCVNIAIAVHQIHCLQKYTLVDLKPQNLLMTADGKISLIDLDSVQIAENGQVLHHAQVATEEFAPAEAANVSPSSQFISEYWDLFSLAVIFYEILTGIHPFTASFKPPYHERNTLGEKIRSGLYVHGTFSPSVQALPPLHQRILQLPSELKTPFAYAFDYGHKHPSTRPTAQNWGIILIRVIQELQNNPKVVQKPILTTNSLNISTTHNQTITNPPTTTTNPLNQTVTTPIIPKSTVNPPPSKTVTINNTNHSINNNLLTQTTTPNASWDENRFIKIVTLSGLIIAYLYLLLVISRHEKQKTLSQQMDTSTSGESKEVTEQNDNKIKLNPQAESFQEIGPFKDGIAYARKNDKWGYINEQYEILIPFEYDNANMFSEGLGNVLKNGKWGFVNLKNETVIPFEYDHIVSVFHNGEAKVNKNGKIFNINMKNDSTMMKEQTRSWVELWNESHEKNKKALNVLKFWTSDIGDDILFNGGNNLKRIYNPDPNELIILDKEPIAVNLDVVKAKLSYPLEAKDLGIHGKVIVRMLIGADGKYLNHIILRSPHTLLTLEVEKQLKLLTFKPGIKEGKPIKCWVTIPFNFNLN